MFEYVTSYSVDHALYQEVLLPSEQLLQVRTYRNQIQIKAYVLHWNLLPSIVIPGWFCYEGTVPFWFSLRGLRFLFDSLFFFTNLIHKFFILINLLRPSTRLEHHCAHIQEDNCINTAFGIVTVFRWLFSTQVTRGIESCLSLCTEQSPKDSDDTRCCVNTIVLLKMSTVVLETCRGM